MHFLDIISSDRNSPNHARPASQPETDMIATRRSFPALDISGRSGFQQKIKFRDRDRAHMLARLKRPELIGDMNRLPFNTVELMLAISRIGERDPAFVRNVRIYVCTADTLGMLAVKMSTAFQARIRELCQQATWIEPLFALGGSAHPERVQLNTKQVNAIAKMAWTKYKAIRKSMKRLADRL